MYLFRFYLWIVRPIPSLLIASVKAYSFFFWNSNVRPHFTNCIEKRKNIVKQTKIAWVKLICEHCHQSIFDWVYKMVIVNSSAATRYIIFIKFHTFSMWNAYNFDLPFVRSSTKRHQINVLACVNISHWNRFDEFWIVVEALQSTTGPTICSIGWNRKRISTNK